MPVYTCSLPPGAAGLAVEVEDAVTHDIVATSTVPDLASDGAGEVDFSTTLDAGSYVACVPSYAASRFRAALTLDVPASIAAGGGGGVVLDGTHFNVANTGQAIALGSGIDLVWDVQPEGMTPGAEVDVPEGAYNLNIELDFDAPTEEASVLILMNGSLQESPTLGPFTIPTNPGDSRGLHIYERVDAWPTGTFSITVRAWATDATAVPDPLALTAGYVEVTRIDASA